MCIVNTYSFILMNLFLNAIPVSKEFGMRTIFIKLMHLDILFH